MEDKSNEIVEVVKKKRGRKPKIKETSIEIESGSEIQMVVTENEEKPLPKKRGRKPKGGKIVVVEQKQTPPEVIKQNVILHLKCSLKDIYETDNVINEISNEILNNTKSNPLNYHVINSVENNTMLNSSVNMDNFNKDHNNLDDKDNMVCKDINSKLKELQSLLHTNEISDKKSACFWCIHI